MGEARKQTTASLGKRAQTLELAGPDAWAQKPPRPPWSSEVRLKERMAVGRGQRRVHKRYSKCADSLGNARGGWLRPLPMSL